MSQLTIDLRQTGILRIAAQGLTRAAYEKICADNRDLRIERDGEGCIIARASAPSASSAASARIIWQLGSWSEQAGTGVAFDARAGFDLPNGANRAPRLSWIRKSRITALTEEQLSGYLPLCPDFVVELVSGHDPTNFLQAKMREYIDNGAQLGWLIDPTTKRIWVYRPGRPIDVLEEPATIFGDPELPGFTLHLAPIWDPEY